MRTATKTKTKTKTTKTSKKTTASKASRQPTEKKKAARASEKFTIKRKTESECLGILEAWKAAVEKAHSKQLTVRKQKMVMQLKIAAPTGDVLGSLGAHWKRQHAGRMPFQFDYLLLLSVYDPAGDAALVKHWISSLKKPLAQLLE